MKIDANAPAFPSQPVTPRGEPDSPNPGLTIRAEIASRVLPSVITALSHEGQLPSKVEAAEWALDFTDALIAELNKEQSQ